jgi:hypothetical protein
VIAIPDGCQQIRRTGSEQHGAGREQTRRNEMTHVDSPDVLLEAISRLRSYPRFAPVLSTTRPTRGASTVLVDRRRCN